MNEKSTVILIDDDDEVIDSLCWLIGSQGHEILSYNNPKDFLKGPMPSIPVCMVLDIRMPQMSGMQLQEYLYEQNIVVPIIFLTGHGDIEMAIHAIKRGAFEFYTKPVNNQALLDSINKALRHSISQQTALTNYRRICTLKKRLTPREYEVMDLMLLGNSTAKIAETLEISANTVELHRSKVLKKMEVRSIVELIRTILTTESAINS